MFQTKHFAGTEMEDLPEEENGVEEVQGSSLTMEKVAAAKQFIENHYRAQMKNIQERKERFVSRIRRVLFVFVVFFFFMLGVVVCLVAEKIVRIISLSYESRSVLISRAFFKN